jgi:glutamyl-tRNA reductase
VARDLRASFEEVAERSVRHALGKDLAHLGDADRAAVEKLAHDLVKRLVQVPLRGLKGAAWNHSSAVIGNFIKGLHGVNGRGGGKDGSP